MDYELILSLSKIQKSLEESEKNYQQLESRLKGNQGNQILVVTQHESIKGCPGIIPPKYIDPIFIGIDTYLQLGLLTSDQSNINKKPLKRLTLPTDSHIEGYDNLKNKWELKEGPINFDFDYLEFLGKELKRREIPVSNIVNDLNRKGLLIHIGQEVEQYFDKKRQIISYVEGLNLLKQPVPENFREEYDKIIHTKKVNIIQRLQELTSLESKINEEIKSIFSKVDRRPQLGGKVLFSTGPDLLGMTEDDAKVVSFGKR
ncbi:MAG: hypothetical protein NT139_03165, partial [Candidatus Woesearchaeota archaeon]|nr:hypothetical protein [Candidatus Woesearchaeota archaeon]